MHETLCEKRDAKKDGKPTLAPPNHEQAGWISGARIVEAAAARWSLDDCTKSHVLFMENAGYMKTLLLLATT